jgi:hypothetical protein
MQQIQVNKDFINFIKGLAKINDAAILATAEAQLTCLIGSPDNVTIAYGIFPCTCNFSGFLNISSLSKLIKALDQIPEEQFTLVVNNNNLEYKSPNLRFKYHLLDNGIINQPAITIRKVLDYTFDVQFKVEPSKMMGISKFSAFSSDSNKIYLAGDGAKIFADLTDKARDNVDSFAFEFTECATSFDDVSLNVDFFRSLNYNNNSEIDININTTVGVIAIDIVNPTYKLKYITTSYTS